MPHPLPPEVEQMDRRKKKGDQGHDHRGQGNDHRRKDSGRKVDSVGQGHYQVSRQIDTAKV